MMTQELATEQVDPVPGRSGYTDRWSSTQHWGMYMELTFFPLEYKGELSIFVLRKCELTMIAAGLHIHHKCEIILLPFVKKKSFTLTDSCD